MEINRKRIGIGATQVAYIDDGSGPVVICLHAIAHSANDYLPLINALRTEFRVIAVDFPGHGESTEGTQAASASYYADVIQMLLHNLAINKFILIGNSIGGAAGIELAARLPEQTMALVLCNPGGLFERSWLTKAASSLFAQIFAQGEKGAIWFKLFYAGFYRLVIKSAVAKQRRLEIVEEAYLRARVNKEAWQSFAKNSSDLRGAAKNLQLPIFVAWAKEDKINKLKFNLPTINTLKNSFFKTYSAGHVPFLECPEIFISDLKFFIKENIRLPAF